MGGCSSKSGNQSDVLSTSAGSPVGVRPLVDGEQNRVESIEESKTANYGRIKVRYGFLSQRGFYPDDANKPNQDSFSISEDICDNPSDSLFCVYDGHGRFGADCAQFAQKQLPFLISKYLKKAKKASNDPADELTKEQVEHACSIAHKKCNTAMHNEKSIDDVLSGTTAISCLFTGDQNRITVCNVGDSRAVLGQRLKRKTNFANSSEDNIAETWRALPLSNDQTPYRRDERKRVKAAGARILSLDQIEGLEPIRNDDDDETMVDLGEEIDEGGDPPRVWSSHGGYPGTAFTRSFGDSIAEEIGVFAEPEMVTRPLSPEDRIIVLASDGVFEFLTNQSVIDICAKYDDPLSACHAVVAESYELWLQYEMRTDDITMMCIFIDDIDDDANGPMSSTVELEKAQERDESAIIGQSSRPVRQTLGKKARDTIAEMKQRLIDEAEELPENFDIAELHTEKTPEEKTRISEAINSVIMIQSLSPEQRDMIIGVMEPIDVKQGEWIIKQGTVGDRFYVVDFGTFAVRKIPEGGEDKTGEGGEIVHTYVGSRESSRLSTFGELALIKSAPRAASVIAQTDGKLWAIHRHAFQAVLSTQPEELNKETVTEAGEEEVVQQTEEPNKEKEKENANESENTKVLDDGEE